MSQAAALRWLLLRLSNACMLLQHCQTVPLATAAGTCDTGLATAADAKVEGRHVPMPDPTPPLCLPPLPESDGERTDGRVQRAACSSALQPSA